MFISLRSPHRDSDICPDDAQAWRSPRHRSPPPVHLTNPQLFPSIHPLVFIYERSWDPTGTNFSISELDCDRPIESRSRNVWKNFMKLTNSEQPVFTNESIRAVSHIFGDDTRAPRSRLIQHTCPSHIKQMTPYMHSPLIHDTFPIHFNKLEMNFGRANVFRIQKSNYPTHLKIHGMRLTWLFIKQ